MPILIKNGFWFLNTLSTSFLGNIYVPNLNTIFIFYFYFFNFFLFVFFSEMTTFKPLKRERERSSSVAKNLQWGGMFWRLETKIKRSWPKFWLVFTETKSVFLPQIRWSPKKQRSSLKFRRLFCPKLENLQKKRSSSKLQASFSGQYQIRFLSNSRCQYHWGNYFCF